MIVPSIMIFPSLDVFIVISLIIICLIEGVQKRTESLIFYSYASASRTDI